MSFPDPVLGLGLDLDLDSIFLGNFQLDASEDSGILGLPRDTSAEDATWEEILSLPCSSPGVIPHDDISERQHREASSILTNHLFGSEETYNIYDFPVPTDDARLPKRHCQEEGRIDESAADGTAARKWSAHAGDALAGPCISMPPKVGGRFSRESVRILRHWLSSNSNKPYPSDSEKKWLQDQTGLNKTQISNWLANARRRGKVQAPRLDSPLVQNGSKPRDVPRRPGTPAPRNGSAHMNPLERWVDSPPEHEPATVTAIARAVASSSRRPENFISSPYSSSAHDGSDKSFCDVSAANSLDTSHSSGSSLASTSSDASRVSFGSFKPFGRTRSRRRKISRRTTAKRSLLAPLKTYQCTFCTETFKTKHDWQRHENSLHLPLDRWICAPDGPYFHDPRSQQTCCVYCGRQNPDDAHIQSHNHSTCQDRSLQERIFNRKDHLNQHLRLVHNVKYAEWPMQSWKAAMPAIRSRCGFCDAALETWEMRANHLADHFKSGKTMADWKGDWGFDPPVLQLIENAIPPYMIDTERYTPFPFEASNAPAESPRNAYELIKLELAYFMQNYFDKACRMPNDDEMQLEACRIILASETESGQESTYPSSWLRDLIMADDSICQQAKFSPLRLPMESRLFALRINGKNNMFEGCVFEAELNDFITANQLRGLQVSTHQLQHEACCIVSRIEEISTTPSDFIANWLVKLANRSQIWLTGFCQRAEIDPPPSPNSSTPLQPMSAASAGDNCTRLESEMALYLKAQRLSGKEPSDEELRQKAQLILYQSGSGRQTVADDDLWLLGFKQRHSCQKESSTTLDVPSFVQDPIFVPETMPSPNPVTSTPTSTHGNTALNQEPSPHAFMVKTGGFFLNDANFYRWLSEELGRWAAATMSTKNPACHIPSDEEIQHYARWIAYSDDDPWNQTAADNQEWLDWFKRENGIINNSPVPVDASANDD